MDYRVTSLERAFQMARSGKFSSVAEIKKQLSIEGYSVAQVTGRVLARQLKELMQEAQDMALPSDSVT